MVGITKHAAGIMAGPGGIMVVWITALAGGTQKLDISVPNAFFSFVQLKWQCFFKVLAVLGRYVNKISSYKNTKVDGSIYHLGE